MCGIAGYWNFQADENAEVMTSRIVSMTNMLFLRGPDSGGAWISPKNGLALGHRRLAIRDLSPAGHQPMSTADGRFVIIYNGEVYNTDPMRRELQAAGVNFSGHSDTEVVLYGCARFGVEATVSRLTGMFAFALWDNQLKKLTLVRDRLGIKPLYWGKFGRLFIFGSELKALTAHPAWAQEIELDAVAGLVKTCFIPAPLSIYKGVYKLRQGHLLEIDVKGAIRHHCWWNPLSVFKHSRKNRLMLPENALIDELDALLRDAVKSRMVADVPIGAFLSGGVDSSVVAALMQAQSDRPVRTFSIGFEEPEYNEAPFAKAVAEHLGTIHTEEYMTARQAWEVIPQIATFYDEPFADSSQLPTYLLSRITRKQVTTALSGDGGDEFFGGYNRYFDFLRNEDRCKRPFWQQHIIKAMGTRLSEQTLNRLARLLPPMVRPANFGSRIRSIAKRLSIHPVDVYQNIYMNHWPDPTAVVPGSKIPEFPYTNERSVRALQDQMASMQFQDTVNYLPDDILVKVDRASMAVSLETRVPLIDHRLFAFTWRLPPDMHVRNGQSKWILRQVLYRYVPKKLIERPKMGFGVPIDHWLRGPLRDWCEELLNPVRMAAEGFIDPTVVQPMWQRHLAGENYQYWLWDVLMFQAWLDNHKVQTRPENAPIAVVRSDL